MYLKAIKFSRFSGQAREWSIEGKPENNVYNQWVTFENINLIVGKNATGKSKTINALRQLADILADNYKLSELTNNTSTYELLFDNNGIEIAYFLDFQDGKIKQEILTVDSKEVLKRNDKQGTMFYQKADTMLDFQMENDKLAVSRVDSIQQPFFEPLHNWGKTLNHYRFGGELGKNYFLREINQNKDIEIDLKDTNQVVGIFVQGKQEFGDIFTTKIFEDMKKINYNIDKISIGSLNTFPETLFGLGVQEQDIDVMTNQTEMSQGMFRALSLLIQLNYSLLIKTPNCILIDDIGEGLDYERSKSLIDLIIEKVENSSVQIIMTTNDRFVMNKIPLEYWSVIHRVPKKSLFYNYRNSKEVFDEFKYTGLSNFDFLSSEFYFEDLETQKEQ